MVVTLYVVCIVMVPWDLTPTVREKGKDLTQFCEKSPYTHSKIKKRTKTFDFMNADRLRTVSWRNDGHPTGVVKPAYGIPTVPLTAKAV